MDIIFSVDEGNLIMTRFIDRTLSGLAYMRYEVKRKVHNKPYEYMVVVSTPNQFKALQELKEMYTKQMINQGESQEIASINFDRFIAIQKGTKLLGHIA